MTAHDLDADPDVLQVEKENILVLAVLNLS